MRENFEQVIFNVIGNSDRISYDIKRHCMPGSAVRGKEYIAVLSAHPRKCATGAHFVPAFLIKIKFLLQIDF